MEKVTGPRYSVDTLLRIGNGLSIRHILVENEWVVDLVEDEEDNDV
jgi:hypothetical protein